MSNVSIREALEAKKAEIEAALEELDRIEALAGLRPSPPPQIDGKSYSQAVLDLLTDGPKGMDELCETLGLTRSQVVNAVQSHRLRKIVKGRRITGKGVVYRLDSTVSVDSKSNLPTLTDAILAYLVNHPGEIVRSGVIAAELEGKVNSSASNFPGAVAATLSTLVKSGKVARHADGYTGI